MPKGWLALAVCLAACSGGSRDRPDRQADWRTLTAARQAAGEQALRAEIQYGAGTMDVRPAAAGTMYHAVLRYDNNQYTPSVRYADGVLRVGIDGEMHGGRHMHTRANRLDLQLGPGVPLDLDVQYGAGEGTLELGGLSVHSASIQTGASKTFLRFSSPTVGTCEELKISAGAAKVDVAGLGNLSPRSMTVEGGAQEVNLDFSGAWRGDTEAFLKMGVGKLTLNVPRDVGVRLTKQSLLAHLEAPQMTKNGDTFVSQGYEGTKRHLNVNIDAAFGAIRLNWIGGGSSF